MIPILFNETATDFTTFGIGVLRECTSCEVTEERNGSFELTLKYPTSGDLFSYLKNERIIVAKPNDLSKNQAFRIYKVTTPLRGEVTVYAQHIRLELKIQVLKYLLNPYGIKANMLQFMKDYHYVIRSQ